MFTHTAKGRKITKVKFKAIHVHYLITIAQIIELLIICLFSNSLSLQQDIIQHPVNFFVPKAHPSHLCLSSSLHPVNEEGKLGATKWVLIYLPAK